MLPTPRTNLQFRSREDVTDSFELGFTEEAFQNPNIRMQDAMCVGEYLVRIIVYSDNSDPEEKRFVIRVPKDWDNLEMNQTES